MNLSFLMCNSKSMVVNNPLPTTALILMKKSHSGESTEHFPVVGKTDWPMRAT